ncbi:NAD-dependent protein deacetylase hst2-1 [Hirsutella minnesotensis 3608]|uniref:NAD-dependent protein deacetylase hst2-1 n=1 Tax=Hirsutella minnesotensis 3608 TaxID=1043627 RepID=A0A0F7ZUH2_9HYPO|nr:NAD-dependent protein deacetylase hst2-1 [Hirsutella minnesotensis 3608]
MGQEESTLVDDSVAPRTLSERTLSAVAEYISSGQKKRIVVLTGAGISTAAGIPDFRSPKTGLYNNLARLNLPYAEAVFDIDYFREHPEPFYVLAQELYPGKFHPTVSHAFIALLARKGLLQMLFTQNIDCLERAAGVPAEKIIEAHGSFATQRCVDCKAEFPDDKMREHVFAGKVPRCAGTACNGIVKPDIVFFGESLPSAFGQNSHQVAMADVVLILGTSLSVYPFAGLPEMARADIPRILFNMERVGRIGNRADDVVELGPCDDGIRKLADALGWRDELERLWRDVVGDSEAERQLRSHEQQETAVEKELEKLAEGVEAMLTLNDGNGDDEDANDGDTVGAESPRDRVTTTSAQDAVADGTRPTPAQGQPGAVADAESHAAAGPSSPRVPGRPGALTDGSDSSAAGDDEPQHTAGAGGAGGGDGGDGIGVGSGVCGLEGASKASSSATEKQGRQP